MSTFKAAQHKALIELRNKGVAHAERTIRLAKCEIKALYVKQIVDTKDLAEFIIKPLIEWNKNEELSASKAVSEIIQAYDVKTDDDMGKIVDYILDGMVVLLLSADDAYIVANIKKVEHRSIPKPEITYTLRGPRDCFTENLDVNLSLIRYRMKDPNLRVDLMTAGKRSKTSVAVIYIEDIANPKIVREIKKRIDALSVDILWGTGELEQMLQNSPADLFTQFGTTERSDWACEALVEGKVLIMVDGGGIAIFLPHTFSETMIACDDRYDNKFFGLFSRIIRYLSLLLTLCSSSFYIAIVSFRADILPANFIITIAQMRQSVLFPAIVDVLIIEFLIELMRESMIRVPTKIGPAIGIVGAIVIGQAAIAAGIFSPLLLIIAATSLMASFAIPNYFGSHPFRILKFYLIFATGILGFYGMILALTTIMISLVSANSFGVPYMAPIAPFNLYDFVRSLFFSRAHSKKRMQYQKTIDDTRSDPPTLEEKAKEKNIQLREEE